MTDVWVWVSHDAETLARGSREHVEAEQDRYERECRERGIVPAVTFIDISGPAAPAPTALPLAEFLLARIAEDVEDLETARISDGPEWWMPDAWTRERGLAECEAKRKLIGLHRRNGYQPTQCAVCGYAEDWEVHENGPTYPCDVLKTLAEPYADHPDYRDDWDEHEPEAAPGDHLPPRLAAH